MRRAPTEHRPLFWRAVMHVLRQRFITTAAVALIAWATMTAGVFGQARPAYPIGLPYNPPAIINTNPYIAPGVRLQQYAYNTAVLARAYSTIPPYALGYNPY